MKKSLFVLLIAGLAASLAWTGLASMTAAAESPIFVCDNSRETALTGSNPDLHVVVEEGATCFIVDAVVHSVRADNPENVYIFGTSLLHGVEHNIMITGTTGNVVIGEEGCGFDPKVGNNIFVRDSNNVLICQMFVDNNISVTGSHGRITIRDSVACNNVTASRNDAYDGPTGNRRNPGAIRLLNLRTGIEVTARDNSGRDVI